MKHTSWLAVLVLGLTAGERVPGQADDKQPPVPREEYEKVLKQNEELKKLLATQAATQAKMDAFYKEMMARINAGNEAALKAVAARPKEFESLFRRNQEMQKLLEQRQAELDAERDRADNVARKLFEVLGQKEKNKAPFVHFVIIYLKDGAPKNAAEMIIADSHTLLGKVPTVRGVWAGRPSEKISPKFGVTGYHVGRLMFFDDAAGVAAYLKHPLHEQYVERHGEHMERVLVYDFPNQQK
jgi:hypothetical protein